MSKRRDDSNYQLWYPIKVCQWSCHYSLSMNIKFTSAFFLAERKLGRCFKLWTSFHELFQVPRKSVATLVLSLIFILL